MTDERDDLMDGGGGVNGPTQRGSSFTKVPWADAEVHVDDRDGVRLLAVKEFVVATNLRVLSNEPFQLTTDRANWFLPQGHTPRCRVHVQTAYLPQSIQAHVLMVGYVDDENDDTWMETLEKRTASTALELEHAVYIRIHVGPHTPEGSYEIPVQLFTQHAGFTDEELSWSTVVYVRVANVTLPPPSQYKFHLDLWQHNSSLARAHGGVPLWSDAHFQLIDRYFRLLAELGQKCVTIVATEMPWAGQHCYTEMDYPSALYEHAVLDVFEDGTDRRIHIDFQYFDRLIALAETYGMATEIEVFGILSIWKDPAHGFGTPVHPAAAEGRKVAGAPPPPPLSPPSNPGSTNGSDSGDVHATPLDSWRIRCVHRTTQRVRYLRDAAEVERFITLFYDHCVTRQLVDRVRICADEPRDLSAFDAQMAFLARLAPRFQVKVALNHLDFLHCAPPQVVDFVPLLPIVCADLQVTTRWKQQIHATKHGRFCWYVCCEPGFPNEFVSSPLVEGELVAWLTFFLGLDGFLRWNYCLWPARPWDSLKWRSASWKVGDMYFVLPGRDGSPVATLRFEALRHAVQTYELMMLAQATLGSAEFAQVQSDVATLIWRSPGQAEFGPDYGRAGKKHPGDLYSLDAEDYERARRLVIDALALAALRLEGGGGGGGGEPRTPPSAHGDGDTSTVPNHSG